MDRKQIIINLRNKRYTYRKIGEIFKISRQRVHQIYTGYSSPSFKLSPDTEIPKNWEPKNIKDYYREKLQGKDGLREIVRKRDNYTCQICNKVWKEGKRRLDVHHIDKNLEGKSSERGIYKIDKENFDKMITLCHKCHLNLKHIKEKMILKRPVDKSSFLR